MKKNHLLIGGMATLMLLAAAAVVVVRNSYADRIGELEEQVEQMRQQERQSAIDRRVSQQMEEIAYGQQALSEERSREAIHQSEIAREMTLRSEAERKNAVLAQAKAEASAREARESFAVAEQQRMEADRQRRQADSQRRQAEYAKTVADTLNYISLAQNIASQSFSIYKAGEREMGNMLAYTAYLFTHDYHGNIYAPSVLRAITQSAEARHEWKTHRGNVSDISCFPNGKRMLTVSSYGEVFIHDPSGGQLNTKQLISDRHLCFRDVLVLTDGTTYAISHTGHLVVIGKGSDKVVTLDGVKRPFAVASCGTNNLVIVGERSLAFYDRKMDKVVSTLPLAYKVVCVGRRASIPLLFDDKGMMHSLSGDGRLTSERQPFQGLVTAYACSDDGRFSAYGTLDGTIYLTDSRGGTKKLVGHLSQVSKVRFIKDRLFSSSYDGKLLFWPILDMHVQPVTLLQTNSWITSFSLDVSQEYMWIGCADGSLSNYLISIPLIAQRLKRNVKRNFTENEWQYYIGRGIPYRNIKE